MMQPFTSYVALGDSWTEGVGDPDPRCPNGVRGWADRVAEVLATRTEGFQYANLAIRGRRTPEIIAEQVEPALAMKPDLVTFQSGGNDVFRPTVDIDAIVTGIDETVARFRAEGATVVLFTHGNGGTSGVIGRLRGRLAIFNELLREVVDRHGAVLVDNWRVPESMDPRFWDSDRIHLSPAGHQRAAMYVLDALGVPHDLTSPDLEPLTALSRREQRRADAQWAREHLAPWISRRVRGRSLGDGIEPKYPVLTPFAPLTGETNPV
ncbi:SGNH/GDSL hydrolase family protein [Nocardioides sp.]|uniref:SGNH/GDSL hydrolase family protein n=1 Tax=Nocardioides sp. TaxID=35761 RepID=UPI0026235953|nr:SGNH/GDSL hydrolase family protein [Nocardioides sp.]